MGKKPLMTVCGTPTYVAPEILSETGYGIEVDNWAAGVICYILLSGFPPFRNRPQGDGPDRMSSEEQQEELFAQIQSASYEFISPYWDTISDQAVDLVRRLLVVNKQRRKTAKSILTHPWISSHTKSVTNGH